MIKCTWRSNDLTDPAAGPGPVMNWHLVFRPINLSMDGLLAVVMSQKLRFFSRGFELEIESD